MTQYTLNKLLVEDSMDKIEAVKKRAAKLYSERVHPNAIYHEIEELIKQHSLDVKAGKIIDEIRVRQEMEMQAPQPPKQTQTSDDHDDDEDELQGDRLYPADREDMLAEYLDERPGHEFRREDLQKHFGFSKDQTQKALRNLKEKRIGYREMTEREPNPQNPNKYRFRKDAVYFSLKKKTDLEFPMTVTFANLDELKAFMETWENA